MKKIILLVVVTFLIISCDKGKDIAAVNSNYVGGWYGVTDSSNHSGGGLHAELDIDSQNNLHYKTYNFAGEYVEDISGTATIIGKRIRINRSMVPYYLTIVSPLTQINSNLTGGYHWTMTLQGQFYTYAFYRD